MAPTPQRSHVPVALSSRPLLLLLVVHTSESLPYGNHIHPPSPSTTLSPSTRLSTPRAFSFSCWRSVRRKTSPSSHRRDDAGLGIQMTRRKLIRWRGVSVKCSKWVVVVWGMVMWGCYYFEFVAVRLLKRFGRVAMATALFPPALLLFRSHRASFLAGIVLFHISIVSSPGDIVWPPCPVTKPVQWPDQ